MYSVPHKPGEVPGYPAIAGIHIASVKHSQAVLTASIWWLAVCKYSGESGKPYLHTEYLGGGHSLGMRLGIMPAV